MVKHEFGFHCEVHRAWIHLLYACNYFLIDSGVYDEFLANYYLRVFMMVFMGQILSRQWLVLSFLVVLYVSHLQ